MIDNATQQEIDRVVVKTLKEAGMREPPFMIDDLLGHLAVDRNFYDLQDPHLLRRVWHRIRVQGRALAKIKAKIKLAAVWLPDTNQICVDAALPAPKQLWASFHDSTHRVLAWHRGFFLGDTAQTLDPEYQLRLEAEANYGASALMFGGGIFTEEALDTAPEWNSIRLLKARYRTSWVTTLRRYVQFGHAVAMAMVVSTAWWDVKPTDQDHRCRHFLGSALFCRQFAGLSQDIVLEKIDENTRQRAGGPVGEFLVFLPDAAGTLHEFGAESFYNRHYILTLLVHRKRMKSSL